MSRYFYFLSLSLSLVVATASASCSNEEINKASREFKDCVDKKEFELLHMDRNKEDKQTFICEKLEELSSECHRSLAKCRNREYVDDKVAIHINSISGILQSLHREISLETCPILLTPEPPTIVQQGGKEGKKPEYEPVTAGSTTASTSTILAVAGLSLTGWARLATY